VGRPVPPPDTTTTSDHFTRTETQS
jgi:hypothetical protein